VSEEDELRTRGNPTVEADVRLAVDSDDAQSRVPDGELTVSISAQREFRRFSREIEKLAAGPHAAVNQRAFSLLVSGDDGSE